MSEHHKPPSAGMSPDSETQKAGSMEELPAEADREQRGLWLPLYFYLGAVLLYGLHEIGGDLEKRLPARTAWLFVPAFLYLAVGAMASGRVPLRGEAIHRQESPRVFWSLVSIYLLAAFALALVGSGVFGPFLGL